MKENIEIITAENHKITNMFKEVSENNNKILERNFMKIQSDTRKL